MDAVTSVRLLPDDLTGCVCAATEIQGFATEIKIILLSVARPWISVAGNTSLCNVVWKGPGNIDAIAVDSMFQWNLIFTWFVLESLNV